MTDGACNDRGHFVGSTVLTATDTTASCSASIRYEAHSVEVLIADQ